jgi:hypothetical protein
MVPAVTLSPTVGSAGDDHLALTGAMVPLATMEMGITEPCSVSESTDAFG